jgi:hypothetical protein
MRELDTVLIFTAIVHFSLSLADALMIDVILESPWIVAGIGLGIFAITIYGWIQTGQKAALYTAGGMLIATLIAVLVSSMVETRQEKVRKLVHSIADHLSANRFDQVIAAIHPEATETVHRAQAELPNYKFNSAKVTGIREIKFTDTVEPPRVVVTMTVVVDVETNGFAGRVPRLVEVTFYESGDQWLVYDYSHTDPMSGFRDEGTFPRP